MSAMTDYLENYMVDGLFRVDKDPIAWPATTAVSLGDTVYATTGDGNVYECTSAGTTAGSEPTWTTTLGGTTTDSGATWTCLKYGVPKRQFFVALFTANPSDTGGGTEVSGGSYARMSYNPSNANWNTTQGGTSGPSSGTGGLTDNALDITFPAPTATWGTITGFAIMDKLTSGNMLLWGALGTNKTVNNNDPAPKFTAGDLNITFA